MRRLRHRHRQHPRAHPGRGRRLRHRPVAHRDGRQVQRRRGHARTARSPSRSSAAACGPTRPVHMARLLRRKSKFLVAFGSCASEGCIPGLANLSSAQEILDTVFSTDHHGESGRTCGRIWEFEVPEGDPVPARVPSRSSRRWTRSWTWTTPIPGCPPESEQIWAVLQAVVAALNGTGPLPPKGSILGAGDLHRLRRVRPQARRQADRPLRPHHGPAHVRPGDLPARAGPALQRPGDAQRLRRAVPGRLGALHRLLRGGRGRASTTAPA